MVYLVNYDQVSEAEFNSKLEDAITEYVDKNYDNTLDEYYPDVKVGNLTFSPSMVVKECDPTAYRCWKSDEVSYQLSDAQSKFSRENETNIMGTHFATREEVYQIWVIEEDVDGAMVTDFYNYYDYDSNYNSCKNVFDNMTEDDVRKHIVESGDVVKKNTTYRIQIETVIKKGVPDGEVNLETTDEKIVIFK